MFQLDTAILGSELPDPLFSEQGWLLYCIRAFQKVRVLNAHCAPAGCLILADRVPAPLFPVLACIGAIMVE